MLGKIVVKHQRSAIDPQMRVHQSSILGLLACKLFGGKGLLVPVDRFAGPAIANGDVRRDPAIWSLFVAFHRLGSLPMLACLSIAPRFPDHWKTQWPGQARAAVAIG